MLAPSSASTSSDTDRAAVYAAEAAVEGWLDLVTPQAPEVLVAGRRFAPEPDPKFTGAEEFERYVTQVLDHLRGTEASYDGREHQAVGVRARRGATQAVYEFETATIAVPPRGVGGRWALRGLVALHELAHHLHGAPGHGPGWRTTFLRLLEDVGRGDLAELLHLAHAQEGLSPLPHDTPEATVAKIAKLLRQGERADNPHERDAFIARAQRLASAASIALAVARAHGHADEAREAPSTEEVPIGEPRQRGLARYVRLMLNIAHANDLKCTIRHGSTSVTLHGFAGDIAVAKALYESLLVQMVAEFETYRRTVEPTREWVWNDRLGDYEFKVPATLSRRLSFYEAFADRIGERLSSARAQALAEASAREAGQPVLSTSTEVAVRAKEVEVHDFYQARLRAEGITSSWRGDRSSAALRAPAASGAGTRAADLARLGTERVLPR